MIIVVGALMIIYVLIGGMKGTTWVQIIKAMLLIAGAAVMTFWVLAIYGFNLSDLLGGAVETSKNPNMLNPGLQYGKTETSKLDFMSLGLALVLGTAALPHVLMRFYTVPTAKEARKSVVWSIWLIGIFYLFTLVLGYGAAALVGADTIKAAPGGVNSAAPLLAFHLGGPLLLGFISAVAFATILAVVAGLTITAAASFAHDIYANVIAKGKADADTEVKVARRTVVVIGILAIVGGIFANGQNVAFLVALAFAVAASANLPTIVYSLFWRRFTTQGAVWSMYGGLASAIILIALSPVVSGAKTSMIPGANFAIFPLSNPGIVSIPLAFFLGWLGTVLDKRLEDTTKQAEMEVRSLTGVGAEKATEPLALPPRHCRGLSLPSAIKRRSSRAAARELLCTGGMLAGRSALGGAPFQQRLDPEGNQLAHGQGGVRPVHAVAGQDLAVDPEQVLGVERHDAEQEIGRAGQAVALQDLRDAGQFHRQLAQFLLLDMHGDERHQRVAQRRPD